MISLQNKEEKLKLFKMALVHFDMTRQEFASSVGENGVSSAAVQHWFAGRMPSRNVETAINELLERFLKDFLDQFSNAA